MATEADWNAFSIPGNRLTPSQTADLDSAALVLVPTGLIQRVTGTSAVTDITVPYSGFKGIVIFIPTGAFTWTTAGNIAVAGTAVVSKALIFVYHPDQAKWYPSYVA